MTTSRGRRALARIATFLAIATLGGLTLGELGRWHWLADLANHFRAQAALPAALALALAALARDRLALLLALPAVFSVTLALVPLYRADAPSTGAPLRLFLANVNRTTGDPAAVAAQISASEADVIGLVEVDDRWLDALAPALSPWPHRLTQTREDNFGLALYSRLPLRDTRAILSLPTPALRATVDVAGAPVGLLLVHPPPPVSGAIAAERDASLRGFVEARAALPARAILLGDLNATPWSVPFRRLLVDGPFREGRDATGAGPVGTWPAQLPGFLRIPIDHILTSGPLAVETFQAGAPNGSDHLPVRATVVVQPVAPGVDGRVR
ncbi:MAG: endonuclease/exonuclease/phosphatase family protein [bacterium]